jgi:hypothetical protein
LPAAARRTCTTDQRAVRVTNFQGMRPLLNRSSNTHPPSESSASSHHSLSSLSLAKLPPHGTTATVNYTHPLVAGIEVAYARPLAVLLLSSTRPAAGLV